jgi:hypothetical protein
MNQHPPQLMSPDAIIAEIGELRGELDVRLTRIHALAQGLYHQVRRAPADDNTSVYITYANAWMRFAGMVNQGVLRTASASKVLRRLTPRAEQAVPPVKKEVPPEKVAETPVDSVLEMYRDPIPEGALVDSPSEGEVPSDESAGDSA